jgi:hypothetical protein
MQKCDSILDSILGKKPENLYQEESPDVKTAFYTFRVNVGANLDDCVQQQVTLDVRRL